MTDAQAVIRAIHAARDAVAALRDASRRPRRSAGERVGGTQELKVPLSLELFDQAELIHYCIQGWARVLEEEQGDPLPIDDTRRLTDYLEQHAAWIATRAWADDLVLELRDHVHTAEGMLGLLPKRLPIPEPCECGSRQWAYPEGEGGMDLECDRGHVKAMRHVVGSTRVSIRGAQRILGIRRETIREALASGEVVNHGTETRPIIDTQALEAYLTNRLRTHSL